MLTAEQGKAAFEHYEKQVRSMDRATLESFAISFLMKDFHERGCEVELAAEEYHRSLKLPQGWLLTEPAIHTHG